MRSIAPTTPVSGGKWGRWIAYTSDELGTFEVYLQSFPELGERIAISSGGSCEPVWRGDGRELYYYVPSSQELHGSSGRARRPAGSASRLRYSKRD